MTPVPPTDGLPRSADRVPLTRDRVLRAAVDYADTHGLKSLSMRKLGQELGVEAMSLYNHVKNKAAILDGMVDAVVAEIVLPPPGTEWQAAMRQRATSAHDVLLRHPWAAMLLMSRSNPGPAMLRYVDATIGILRGAGFSIELADRAWNAVDSFLYGFTLQELNFPFQPDEYSDVAAEYLPSLSAEDYPHMTEMTLAVINGEHDGVQDFSFGLELLLAGLEQLRRRTP